MKHETLGQRIRRLREARGLSQVGLARRLNASTNAINLLEQYRISDPHWLRLVAIANLKVTSGLPGEAGPITPPRPRSAPGPAKPRRWAKRRAPWGPRARCTITISTPGRRSRPHSCGKARCTNWTDQPGRGDRKLVKSGRRALLSHVPPPRAVYDQVPLSTQLTADSARRRMRGNPGAARKAPHLTERGSAPAGPAALTAMSRQPSPSARSSRNCPRPHRMTTSAPEP